MRPAASGEIRGRWDPPTESEAGSAEVRSAEVRSAEVRSAWAREGSTGAETLCGRASRSPFSSPCARWALALVTRRRRYAASTGAVRRTPADWTRRAASAPAPAIPSDRRGGAAEGVGAVGRSSRLWWAALSRAGVVFSPLVPKAARGTPSARSAPTRPLTKPPAG